MSERFDVLFAGLSEEKALQLLETNPDELDNPVEKYTAATRLAASKSQQSLDGLIAAVKLDPENLFNRITRRKALEGLGRRRDKRAIPALFKALDFDDEPSVINAIDSIAQIGCTLDDSQTARLLGALHGSDNQKRSAIQAHTRLGLQSGVDSIADLEQDDNPLVAGAAKAYAAKVHGRVDRLASLVQQLDDAIAGRRRAAVIDLGDAGDIKMLPHLVTCPVSMPLRAKSAFQLVDPGKTGRVPEPYVEQIKMLLQDDPSKLSIHQEWICNDEISEIEKNLQHRDEGKQYGGAIAILKMANDRRIETIDHIHARFWSDYGANYLITAIVGLKGMQERSDLVRTALAETLPQYAKSRVAAAWACLSLELRDQKDLLQNIHDTAQWTPLKWSCMQVLQHLS